MKILHVVKLYSPWVGGVEKVAQEIAEGISKDREVSVLCCNPNGPRLEETLGGVRVVRASASRVVWGMPLSADFFAAFVEEAKNHDIIHIHLPFPLASLALFLSAGALADKKIVVTYHADLSRQKIVAPLLNPFTRHTLSRANKIVVSSPNLAEHSKMLGRYRDKIVVIPFGVDETLYSADEARQKRAVRLRNSEKCPIILFVGRLAYYKGILNLIEAFKGINATLWIAGDGELRKKAVALAAKLGLKGSVRFFGAVSDEQKIDLYCGCDIFAFPSTSVAEAFGLVQMEAMMCGKPVINTNLPTGVPFVSVNGETGITVRPGSVEQLHDALTLLVKEKGLREKLGAQAKLRAQKLFTLNGMIAAHENLYKRL